jgi:hypothetical protein
MHSDYPPCLLVVLMVVGMSYWKKDEDGELQRM